MTGTRPRLCTLQSPCWPPTLPLHLLDHKRKWRSSEMTGRVSLGQNCVLGSDARSLSRQLRNRLEASEEEPSFSSRPCGPGSSVWGWMRVSDLCQKGPALPRGGGGSEFQPWLHPGLTISSPPTEPLLCAVRECGGGGSQRLSVHLILKQCCGQRPLSPYTDGETETPQ